MFRFLTGKAVSRLGKCFEIGAAVVTVLGVAVSAYFYVIQERPSRRRDAVYTAWQVLASMEGKRGGGGRRSAIAQLRAYKEDLSGLNLDSSFLKGLDLSGSKLSGVIFSNARLPEATFEGCHILSAKFDNAQLSGVKFTKSTLGTTDFNGAVVTDADFSLAEMSHCIGGSSTTFNGSTFTDVVIRGCQFSGANFDNTSFSNSKLAQVGLHGSQMRRSVLTHSVWREVQAGSVDLSLAVGTEVSIGEQCDLSDSRWDRAQLESARFEGVNLSKARFFGSILTNASFIDSDLSGADFSSSALMGVTIQKCKVEGLLLSGANQAGLRLLNCIGQPVDLRISGTTK